MRIETIQIRVLYTGRNHCEYSGQCQFYLDPRIVHVHVSSPAVENPVSWFSVERQAEESLHPLKTNTRSEQFCRSFGFPAPTRFGMSHLMNVWNMCWVLTPPPGLIERSRTTVVVFDGERYCMSFDLDRATLDCRSSSK